MKLPELGEGVTEGELVKWTVNIGDTVKADQTVAEIMGGSVPLSQHKSEMPDSIHETVVSELTAQEIGWVK